MAKSSSSSKTSRCEWFSGPKAFREFATHKGKTQSARHIKPLHWYVACRLVLEGGFDPDDITPRPPFVMENKRVRKGAVRRILSYDPSKGGSGEQVVLGGLKTKNVDVVVNKNKVGPVLAISCKGVTKAFRNLTNRMEETIGECTNLHITYPAMVVGYFAILRANRTLDDVRNAPDLSEEDSATDTEPSASDVPDLPVLSKTEERMKANDIAILPDGRVVEGIVRFHAALREMTSRLGLRDEISRYEAMTMVLVEPGGPNVGQTLTEFPPVDSPLHFDHFFKVLYQRYEERFIYGAPLLAERGITTRYEWDPESPAFVQEGDGGEALGELDFIPRIASSPDV